MNNRYPPISRRARRSVGQYWPLIFVAVILTLALIAMLGQSKVSRALNQPLGPTLPPLDPHSTPVIIPIPGGPETVIPGPPATPTPGNPLANLINPPLPALGAKCGGTGELTILLIGSDNENGYNRGLADAILLVRLNFTSGSIATLAFPRDLWVKIPDLTHNAEVDLHELLGDVVDENQNPLYPPGDYGKLNVPYFYGNLYDYPGRGPGLLAKTMQVNFGVAVDHYVVINMHVFPDLIDAVGGIDIDVPKDINDPEKHWTFQKGRQHMDGEKALEYARTRITDSVWARMNRQDQVIMAYRDRILQPDVWPRIPTIVDTFLNDIFTDLTRAEIASMTCLVGQTPREQIRNYVIDANMVTVTHTTTGSWVVLPQPVAIGKVLYQFLYGLSY